MKSNFLPGMQFPVGSERRDYILSDRAVTLEINEMVFYPPYAIDTNHYHNCMEIGICMEGGGTLTMAKKAYAFSAGTIIIVPEGMHHSQQNQGDPCTRWRYIVVDLRRYMTEMPVRCRETITRFLRDIRQRGLYLENGNTHEEVLRLLYTMFDMHSRYAGEAGAELEALVLMVLLRAAREPIDEHMNAVIDPLHMKSIEPSLLYVSENYRQEIRVREMARACAMSESYFRKVFTRLIGLSPLEYVNRHRIHRAMHLLHVTGDSVQHIALACGFSSVATFSRNFIRYVGQNPSSWRRHHVSVGQEMDDEISKNAEND